MFLVWNFARIYFFHNEYNFDPPVCINLEYVADDCSATFMNKVFSILGRFYDAFKIRAEKESHFVSISFIFEAFEEKKPW